MVARFHLGRQLRGWGLPRFSTLHSRNHAANGYLTIIELLFCLRRAGPSKPGLGDHESTTRVCCSWLRAFGEGGNAVSPPCRTHHASARSAVH